ncbi:hypothetical protein NC99_30300 [Sunxiuqinia dokdonensis]|uniref:Uncharacterized protein n=1 Tax=Sunxiuqinia dokdonensis TaxID=1409788 RepID=A0A0L8V749_9BACT|nr:hypothetical protein NC99_30300 [Sunxiuqinia dokdonensis]
MMNYLFEIEGRSKTKIDKKTLIQSSINRNQSPQFHSI